MFKRAKHVGMTGASVAKWPPLTLSNLQTIFNGGGLYCKIAARNMFKLANYFVMAGVSIAKWPPPPFSNVQTIL